MGGIKAGGAGGSLDANGLRKWKIFENQSDPGSKDKQG